MVRIREDPFRPGKPRAIVDSSTLALVPDIVSIDDAQLELVLTTVEHSKDGVVEKLHLVDLDKFKETYGAFRLSRLDTASEQALLAGAPKAMPRSPVAAARPLPSITSNVDESISGSFALLSTDGSLEPAVSTGDAPAYFSAVAPGHSFARSDVVLTPLTSLDPMTGALMGGPPTPDKPPEYKCGLGTRNISADMWDVYASMSASGVSGDLTATGTSEAASGVGAVPGGAGAGAVPDPPARATQGLNGGSSVEESDDVEMDSSDVEVVAVRMAHSFGTSDDVTDHLVTLDCVSTECPCLCHEKEVPGVDVAGLYGGPEHPAKLAVRQPGAVVPLGPRMQPRPPPSLWSLYTAPSRGTMAIGWCPCDQCRGRSPWVEHQAVLVHVPIGPERWLGTTLATIVAELRPLVDHVAKAPWCLSAVHAGAVHVMGRIPSDMTVLGIKERYGLPPSPWCIHYYPEAGGDAPTADMAAPRASAGPTPSAVAPRASPAPSYAAPPRAVAAPPPPYVAAPWAAPPLPFAAAPYVAAAPPPYLPPPRAPRAATALPPPSRAEAASGSMSGGAFATQVEIVTVDLDGTGRVLTGASQGAGLPAPPIHYGGLAAPGRPAMYPAYGIGVGGMPAFGAGLTAVAPQYAAPYGVLAPPMHFQGPPQPQAPPRTQAPP